MEPLIRTLGVIASHHTPITDAMTRTILPPVIARIVVVLVAAHIFHLLVFHAPRLSSPTTGQLRVRPARILRLGPVHFAQQTLVVARVFGRRRLRHAEREPLVGFALRLLPERVEAAQVLLVRRDFLVRRTSSLLVQTHARTDAAAARAAARGACLGRAGAEGRLARQAGGGGGERAEGLAEAAALEVAGRAGGGFAVAVDLGGGGAAGGGGGGGAEVVVGGCEELVVGGCEERVVRLERVDDDAWGAVAVACGWGMGEAGDAGVGDRSASGAGVAGEGV